MSDDRQMVTEGYVLFETSEGRPLILNQVPLKELQFLPRIGERVYLCVPLADDRTETPLCDVTGVEYDFVPAEPSADFTERDARLLRVIIYVTAVAGSRQPV